LGELPPEPAGSAAVPLDMEPLFVEPPFVESLFVESLLVELLLVEPLVVELLLTEPPLGAPAPAFPVLLDAALLLPAPFVRLWVWPAPTEASTFTPAVSCGTAALPPPGAPDWAMPLSTLGVACADWAAMSAAATRTVVDVVACAPCAWIVARRETRLAAEGSHGARVAERGPRPPRATFQPAMPLPRSLIPSSALWREIATFRSAALPSSPERRGKLGIAMTTQSAHAAVAAEATPALSRERTAPRTARPSIVRRRFVFTTFPSPQYAIPVIGSAFSASARTGMCVSPM
jgi:hypothetical protein